MDPQHDPGDVICIHLCLSQKIAAVHQAKAVNLPCMFSCIRPFEGNKWVVITAAASSHAVHGLNAMLQPPCLYVPLPGPGPCKLHHLKHAVRQVQAGAHGLVQDHAVFMIADEPGAPCDNRKVLINRVSKNQFCLYPRILQGYLQGGSLPRLFRIGGRQPLKGGLSFTDTMGFIDKFRDAAPVGLEDVIGRTAHIAVSIGWIFLFDVFHGKFPVPFIKTGRHGTNPYFQHMLKRGLVPDRLSIVQMAQLSVAQYCHDITYLMIIQVEFPSVLMYFNWHIVTSNDSDRL